MRNSILVNRDPIKQMNDYAISKWVNELRIMNSQPERQQMLINAG